jgi:putative heme-binding domain-containing protein
MFHRLLCFLTILSLPTLAGAQSPLDELTAADLAEGEKIFKVHCARCHGIDGQGGEGSNLVRSKLKYATDDQALIDLLDEGIPGTGMPAIWSLDEQKTAQVAGYVLTLGQLDAEEMPGDPVRGAEIYQSSGGCSACHIIAGHGIGIGPELTHVGDQRGVDYLRQSLTDPAATQSQTMGYQDYLTVRVKSLQTEVEGLRINEDAFTVQVRDMSGTIHSFRKDELTEFEKVFAHSLMPEYSAAFSDEDMDDLVSYMMSLRSEQ